MTILTYNNQEKEYMDQFKQESNCFKGWWPYKWRNKDLRWVGTTNKEKRRENFDHLSMYWWNLNYRISSCNERVQTRNKKILKKKREMWNDRARWTYDLKKVQYIEDTPDISNQQIRKVNWKI